VRTWNRGAERIYGVRADEALGRDAREAVSLEMSDVELAEALQEIVRTGRLRVEQVQHRKDGTPIYVDSLTIAMSCRRAMFATLRRVGAPSCTRIVHTGDL
jgi:PAS domain S-box-containing protein